VSSNARGRHTARPRTRGCDVSGRTPWCRQDRPIAGDIGCGVDPVTRQLTGASRTRPVPREHDPSATASGAVASGAAMADAGGHRRRPTWAPVLGRRAACGAVWGFRAPAMVPVRDPLEPEVGFEPTTCSLRVSCSAGLSYPGGRSSMARRSRMGGRRRSRSWSRRDSVGLRTMASAAAWMAATAEMAARASPVPVARTSP
jgi:hypothetical protein